MGLANWEILQMENIYKMGESLKMIMNTTIILDVRKVMEQMGIDQRKAELAIFATINDRKELLRKAQ